MTAERIDHAAKARTALAAAQMNPADADVITDPWLLAAQVNATLALVEQQRLSNLITLADHAHARFGKYAGEAGGTGVLFSYGETPESNIQLRADIREGLGL